MPTPRHRHTKPDPADHAQPTTLVAVEAMLLRPRRIAGSDTITTGQTGPWPIFALIVVAPGAPQATDLFDLLPTPRSAERIAVVDSRCHWSVRDTRRALLTLAVHANAPVRFDVDIVLPAQPALDVLARGATLALTTPRRATKLTDRVDIGDALHELVLLGRTAPADLAALRRTLRRAHANGRPGTAPPASTTLERARPCVAVVPEQRHG